MEKLNIFEQSGIESPPEDTAFDHALTVGKFVALVFPYAGSGLAFIEALTGPIRSKRMAEWCEDLRQSLNQLSRKIAGLTPERLLSDDAFFSAFAQATQAAFKTHQKKKREALRNTLLNIAAGKQFGGDRQQQFLALLDRFSEAHLQVLRFLDNPDATFRESGRQAPVPPMAGTKMLVNLFVQAGLPELVVKPDSAADDQSYFQFTELMLEDLVACQMITLERLQNTWAMPSFPPRVPGGSYPSVSTHLGQAFLGFITSPLE